jgi:hypothetical protein
MPKHINSASSTSTSHPGSQPVNIDIFRARRGKPETRTSHETHPPIRSPRSHVNASPSPHQHVTNRPSRDSQQLRMSRSFISPRSPAPPARPTVPAHTWPLHARRRFTLSAPFATESARIGDAWFHVIDVLARSAAVRPLLHVADRLRISPRCRVYSPKGRNEPSSGFTRFQATTEPRAGDSSPMIMPNYPPSAPDVRTSPRTPHHHSHEHMTPRSYRVPLTICP